MSNAAKIGEKYLPVVGERRPLAARGAALLLLSTASFGLMPIFDKFAYAEGPNLKTLLAVRFVIDSILHMGSLACHRGESTRGPAAGEDQAVAQSAATARGVGRSRIRGPIFLLLYRCRQDFGLHYGSATIYIPYAGYSAGTSISKRGRKRGAVSKCISYSLNKDLTKFRRYATISTQGPESWCSPSNKSRPRSSSLLGGLSRKFRAQ